MHTTIRLIRYVEGFRIPNVKEAYYPKRAFKGLEVAPARDEWDMAVHRMTPATGGCIHYAGGLLPPAWGNNGLARLLYIALHESEIPNFIGRDKDKCNDRRCVNPEHMRVYLQNFKAVKEPDEEPNSLAERIVAYARRSCEISRKVGYETGREASAAVAKFRKQYKGRIARKRIRAYECPSPFCGQWHITTHAK